MLEGSGATAGLLVVMRESIVTPNLHSTNSSSKPSYISKRLVNTTDNSFLKNLIRDILQLNEKLLILTGENHY